jgi:DNA (cytosine-5)-methyltransferase 1
MARVTQLASILLRREQPAGRTAQRLLESATICCKMQEMAIPPLERRALTALERVATIARIAELVELRYRSRDLGNLQDPLDEAVYILLSKQTREAAYQTTFANLRARWPSWSECLVANESDIKAVIAPAGFGNQRARQLKALLGAVAEECERRGYDGVTLKWLGDLSDRAAERALINLPGIGPKTARCIMHYSLGRNTFAVDANIRRIFDRLGLVADDGKKVRHEDYDVIVPSRLRRALHVNLIHHGRDICRPRAPLCQECPLISFCQTGRGIDWSQDTRPVAVDVFAGGGGLSVGFSEAGFRVAAAVEWDRNAAQTYRLNHPGTVVIEADARKIDARAICELAPSADRPVALIAGPPCQGYSVAGKRQPEDEKNRLFLEVTRLARDLRPRFVVIENVPGIRSVGGVSFTKAVLHELHESGFGGKEYLLRACDYGVPQLRRRVLFLAQRYDIGEAPKAPASTHCSGAYCHAGCGDTPGANCGALRATSTVTEVLSDLPVLGPGEDAEYRVVDGVLLLNGSTMKHSRKVIEKIKGIAPGKGPISYRRLHSDLARTIVAGHRALPVHPFVDRTISVREAARIQGFKDSHIFCGTRGQQPLQVANAVPPALARAVAEELLSVIDCSDSG